MLETPEARKKLRRKLESWPDDRKSPLTINQGLELLDIIEKKEKAFECVAGLLDMVTENAVEYNKEADWLAAALVCACTIGKSCDFGAGHICRHCEKGWSKEYWRKAARKAVMDGARLSRNPENDCA